MSLSTIPLEFRDRRGSLLVAGILEIILGAASLMLSAMVLLAGRSGRAEGVSMSSVTSGLVVYLGAAAVFVTLGIGSINARRWARSLWVAVSKGWLISGVVGMIYMSLYLPDVFRTIGPEAPSPQVFAIIMAVMGVFALIFAIIIPLVAFLYYRSPDVRATCEAADAGPAWTDRCPQSVLTAAVWLGGVMAPVALSLIFTYGGRFPLFGSLTGGALGILLWLAVAAGCVATAVALYRMKGWAWGTGMAILIVLMVSHTITFARADTTELFRIMAIPDNQAELMEEAGLTRPIWMVGSGIVTFLPVLILLFSARRGSREAAAAPEPALE